MAAKAQTRTRRARGSLSAEEILAGAYELVARDGLDELSMPILARHLGAGVTSLYWYFRNKEELLVALAGRVTEDFYGALPPVGDGPWDEELHSYFLEFRQVLRKFPVYLDLFAIRPRFVITRPQVYGLVLRRLDDEVAVLVRAGMEPETAARTYNACSMFTRGFVLLENGHARESDVDADVHDELVDRVEHLDPVAFPILHAIGDVDPVTELGDDAFEAGLRVLIEGVKSEIEANGSAPTRSRRRRRT